MRNKGLTAAVLAALDHEEWRTHADVARRVPEQFKASLGTILGQKVIAGWVEKQGFRHHYQYRLAATPPVRTNRKARRAKPTPAASTRAVACDPVGALIPRPVVAAPFPPIFAASLGTVVGERAS